MPITFKVGFQVDDKELKTGLAGIQNDIKNAFSAKITMSEDIAKATQQAMLLEKALKRATTDKGLSYSSLTAELRKANSSAVQLTTSLAAGGQAFQASLNAANSALALSNRQVISLNSKIKEMNRVMVQSFKFTAAQTALQAISNAARDAYQWVYDLNKVITDISIVTGYQGEQLDKVTQSAIQGARELRIAADDYAKGTLIFYQQGLNDDEVARRTEITVKAARAASSSMDEMSSQLTAIWNTYQMAGDEMQRAASVGAKMAADTAVDFSDIAEAMQTAAAPAEQMGVSYNSLAAIIATVGDTTQQSASVIGNAFKTIFSRFQQLKSSGSDGEVTLNRVSTQLQELGINVLDASGELRQLDDVIMEVGNQWDSWSSKQQLAIAQIVGGTRQYGQFLTLMNNFNKYQDLLSSANMEDGSALEQQYESSLNSIESAAENAGEAWKRAFSNLLPEDVIKTVYQVTEGLGNVVNGIMTTVGGLPGLLSIIGGLLSNKIATHLANAAKHANELRKNLTEAGRAENINSEYSKRRSGLDAQIEVINSNTGLTQAQKSNQTQYLLSSKKKLELDNEIALINDKINTKLKTASDEQKIQLTQYQEMLKVAQSLNAEGIDELRNLQDKINKENELYRIQEQQLQTQLEINSQRQSKYTIEQNNLNKQLNENTQKMFTSGAVDAKTGEIKNAQQYNQILAEREVIIKRLAVVQDKLFENSLERSALDSQKNSLNQQKQLEIQFKNLLKSIIDVKTGITQLDSTTIQNLTTQVNNFIALVDTMAQRAGTQASPEILELKNNILGLIQALDKTDSEGTPNIDNLIVKMRELGSLVGMTSDQVDLLTSNFVESAGKIQIAGANTGHIKKKTGETGGDEDKPKKSKQNIEDLTQGVMQLGVQALSTGLAVSTMFNSFASADTASEKLQSVLMGVTTLVPNILMLSSTISRIPPLLNLGSKAWIAFGGSAAAAEAAATMGISLIITAVTTLISLLPNIIDYFHQFTAEGQLEKAREQAESLSTALDQAKNSSQELTSQFDEYDTLVDKLKSCTTGSEEWAEALAQVNNKVLELLSLFPDLSQYITRTSEGMLEISEEGIQKIVDQQEAMVMGLQIASSYADQIVREKDIENQKSNLLSDTNVDIFSGIMATNVIRSGTTLPDDNGEEYNVTTYGSGEYINTTLQDILMEKAQEIGNAINEDEIANILTEALEAKGIKVGIPQEDENGQLIEGKYLDPIMVMNIATSLKEDYGPAIKSYSDAIRENEDITLASNQAIADSITATKNFSNEVKEAGGRLYGDLIEQAKQDIANKELSKDDLKNLYGQLTGQDVSQASWQDGEITIGDATFTEETMQAAIAGIQVQDQLIEKMSNLASTIDVLTASTNGAEQALGDFLGNGLIDSVSKNDLSSLEVEMGDSKNQTYNADGEMTSFTVGSYKATQKEAEKAGFNTVQEYFDAVNQAIENSKADFSKVGTDFVVKPLKDSFLQISSLVNFRNSSLKVQQQIEDMFIEAYANGGAEGRDAFIDIMEEANKLSFDDFDIFINELGTLDWATASPESLITQLEEAGVATDNFTNTSLQNLIDYMNKASGMTFDQASEDYNKYMDIGQDLDYGSQISNTDFQTLTDNGTNLLTQFFEKTQSGMWVLTQDAELFHTKLREQSQLSFNILDTQIDQSQQYLQKAKNAIEEYGLTDTDIQHEATGNQQHIGTEIVSAQSAYLQYYSNQNPDFFTGEEKSKIQNWAENGTLDPNEYAEIAEMANRAGISIAGVTEAIDAMNEAEKQSQDSKDLQEFLNTLSENDIDADEVFEMADGLQELAKESEDAALGSEGLSEDLVDNEKAAREVAKEIKRYDKAVESVADNYEDWSDALESGNLEDQTKAINEMEEAYGNMLDIDGSQLSQDFLTNAENLELMKAAAEGDVAAMQQLAEAAQNDILLHAEFAPEEGTNLYNQVMAMTSQIQDSIQDVEVGAELNVTGFLAELSNLVNMAGLTADEATAYLSSMGIDAEIEEDKTKTQDQVVKQNIIPQLKQTGTMSVPVVAADGSITYNEVPIEGVVYDTEPADITETRENTNFALKVTGATRNGNTFSSGGNFKHNNSTSGSGNSSPKKTGGGGGGSKSTPKHSAKKASKYESIKDRYSTVKSSIDEVQRSVDALSDAQDDAWGASKVRNLQKINTELQRQAKNLQQLRKLSLNYLETDKKDAQIAARDLITNLTKEGLPGLNLDQVLFNGEGFVRNRTELTTQLDNYLKALYEPYYQAAMAYDRANSTDEAESERIDNLKEKYEVAKAFVDEFLAALDLVDETAQEAADALEQQLENIREWMANKVEEATYKMEFQIGINERDISLIEQAIELWGDLGTMMGKTFDQLGKKMREETENFNLTLEHGNRMIEIINNINPSNANRDWFIGEFGEEAWNKYITGNGGLPAEVLDAMQDDADSMIEYMNSMYDIAEEMFGQYIEVLNMYMDEFDKIADKISANNDKLEMFTELLEFSGKKWTSDGRDAIRSIADATVDNAQLEVERAASALELAKQGAEETTAQLEEFYAEHGKDAEGYNDTEAFVYNQLKAAKDEADQLLADAQSDMTSSIQDLASAAADAIEMVAEVIKDEVVENLGGDFASFDDMTSMYDQQYDLDTFFLRDFDKEYQLNSLLGEIDDQMENITDPGRLKEYEALIEEINAANQEGVDLTQTDVDLLKAKFEIQKAQDAYEEAQNAKNTMRLARDASGNWNYVYSSDQSETDDAAQALADAQYNYEKLLWEASDEASQYWLQAQQEFFQFQETIDWARYEHDADYKRMIDQQLAYYQQKTELYANQIVKYNGMLDVAFEDTTLGVITNCKDMNSAQEWYTTQHTKYTNDLKQNTKDYQGQVEETCNQVGIKYDELEETVKTETELMGKENDALREKIKTLNTEGSRALTKLDDKVRNFRENFIQHMEACQKKLEAFLKTLKQMENASINEMYNTGFDAGTDYTAEIHNYIGQKLEEGYTEEQLLADEGLKSLVTELKNKLGSEELYYAGHGTVKDKWGQQGWDFVDKYLQSAIDEAMDYFLSGNFEIWDTVDEWVQNHPNWRELAQQNWGKPPETATGGLIRTPQIRSVAEDGAELILNSEDTKNILSAVAHMRDIVKMKMSSINGTLGKKTSGVVDKTIINKDIQQIEQQVHIDATFPNVSVASEIEEAFSNLVNQAVQYVSQKNRQ